LLAVEVGNAVMVMAGVAFTVALGAEETLRPEAVLEAESGIEVPLGVIVGVEVEIVRVIPTLSQRLWVNAIVSRPIIRSVCLTGMGLAYSANPRDYRPAVQPVGASL
jgi:hypothetical protein